MSNIKEVIEKFRGNESTVSDFRDVVSVMVKDSPESIIPNNTFSHALVLTELMLNSADNEIRILTGDFFGTFVIPLKEAFIGAIKRLNKINNSLIRIILVDSSESKTTNLLDDLSPDEKKKVEIVYAKYSGDVSSLQHFICVDSNKYRIETPHQPLTMTSDENLIKAEVCFNDEITCEVYRVRFDNIWNTLQTSK